MTKEAKEKRDFRNTSTWKKFRKEMYKLSNGKDYITGKPLRKGWQLHHLDLDFNHYKQLDPCNFRCLNKTTHEMVHFLYRYNENKDYVINQLNDVLGSMIYLNNILPKIRGDKNDEKTENN